MGDVELFRRLAQDADLPGPLRRRARRREALAQFKLASRALREGDRQGAWERLGKAWMFPERALPVTALAMANLLPRGVLRQLASRGAGSHALTRRAFSLSRVELRSDPALLASAREGTL